MTENTAFLEQPCKTCGTAGWERVQRSGFVQKTLLPFFDLYPWRCPICNKERYFALRADPRIKHARNSTEHAVASQHRARVSRSASAGTEQIDL